MLLLIATVVGVVRAEPHRIAVARREANAPVGTPTQHRCRHRRRIQRLKWFPTFRNRSARLSRSRSICQRDTATLHGTVVVMDPKTNTRVRVVDPPKEGDKRFAKWQQLQAMGGRAVMTYLHRLPRRR